MFKMLREVKENFQIALRNEYLSQGWEGRLEEISTILHIYYRSIWAPKYHSWLMERTIAGGIVFLGGLRQFPTHHEHFEGFFFEENRINTVYVNSS